MSSLFIDSSHHLTLGLIGDGVEWKSFNQKQNSKILHTKIYELLDSHGLKFRDLESLYICSGPGSYTGIRLSEGVAAFMEWAQVPVYSFYHFEVPYLLGVKKGVWLAKAFKGEVFVYSWDNKETKKGLIKEKEVSQLNLETENIYSIKGISPQEEFVSTLKMIEENSKSFFEKLLERKKRLAPYYYRSLEEEFRPSFQ